MSTYLDSQFTQFIPSDSIHTIFELGSRDLHDAVKLYDYYKSPIYAFECSEDCLKVCRQTQATMTDEQRRNIYLIDSAVSITNGPVIFYPFDLSQYNNMGASSMLKIDFTKRETSDGDYGRTNPQKEITVPGIRIDTFITNNNINTVDLVCMDLQGYELMALMSFGQKLNNVKYIITECQIKSTYNNGVDWNDLNAFLTYHGFTLVTTDMFGLDIPKNTGNKYVEFNALFKNTRF
jgi:FkbM family methyltransferase